MTSMGMGMLLIWSTAFKALRTSNNPGPSGRSSLGLKHALCGEKRRSRGNETSNVLVESHVLVGIVFVFGIHTHTKTMHTQFNLSGSLYME